jgi:hypothetical protein
MSNIINLQSCLDYGVVCLLYLGSACINDDCFLILMRLEVCRLLPLHCHLGLFRLGCRCPCYLIVD